MSIMQQVKESRQLKIAILAVVGGFLLQMTLVGIYNYGNMAPYTLLYMKNYTKDFRNRSLETFWLWIFDLIVFGFGSSMALGGYIEAKMGPFFTLILGSWIMSCSIIACYWTIKVNVIALAATHGLLAAIGAGIAYSVSVAAPIEWFPESKGLVCGIVVSGFAFGPFIFDFLQAFFINHNISQIRIDDPSKVPLSFVIVGAVYVLIQLVGAILTKRRKPIVEEISDNDIIPLFQSKSHQTNIKPHQLFFERDFWILWMSYSLNSSVSIMILTFYQEFGRTLMVSHVRLTIVGESATFCNAIGRIMWGYLNDRVAYKVLMSILTVLTTVMVGTFYCCAIVDGVTRYTMYFVWAVTLHLLLSGNYSIFPSMSVKTFGVRHFAGNYGVLFTAFSFSALVTSLTTFHLLNDTADPKKFMKTFVSGCGLSVLSCIITQFYVGKLRCGRN